MESKRQKDLILIHARELASKLATAMFIADAEGDLVFYNEAAEEILGRTFAEAGEMSAESWTSLFQPETLEGQPMALGELPPGIALLERKSAHDVYRITCLDKRRRVVSVTFAWSVGRRRGTDCAIRLNKKQIRPRCHRGSPRTR